MAAPLFDWDGNNRRKLRLHRVAEAEAVQALENSVFVYSQQAEDEEREMYYGETKAGRMLAVVVTMRGDVIRVVTAYDMNKGQKEAYLRRRAQEQL